MASAYTARVNQSEADLLDIENSIPIYDSSIQERSRLVENQFEKTIVLHGMLKRIIFDLDLYKSREETWGPIVVLDTLLPPFALVPSGTIAVAVNTKKFYVNNGTQWVETDYGWV